MITDHRKALAIASLALTASLTSCKSNIAIEGRPDPDPNRAILPAEYIVYTQESSVVNSPTPGFEETVLPTANQFIGEPGCYVACYSRNPQQSVYSVGGGIHVMGQVRVPGSYDGKICRPQDYEQADISAEESFKQLCADNLPEVCEGNSCWAGGDTGGWFDIP